MRYVKGGLRERSESNTGSQGAWDFSFLSASLTQIHAAKIRPCLMDCAHGKLFVIKPEEWAGKWSLIKNCRRGKNFSFVLINDYNLPNTGDKVLYKIFKRSDLFHDAKNIAHVTAAIATSVAGIWW